MIGNRYELKKDEAELKTLKMILQNILMCHW